MKHCRFGSGVRRCRGLSAKDTSSNADRSDQDLIELADIRTIIEKLEKLDTEDAG